MKGYDAATIQPITLRVKGERYEIVCGERRYRASLMAQRTSIPAVIKEYSDAEAMEICILENLQRRNVSPVEEAVSFGKLMEIKGYSIEDLVKQGGKTDKYIRSRLQLRNLTDEISELLAGEEITLAAALEIARFCPDIQRDVYENHLSADDSYSWKRLPAKDFRRMLESKYSSLRMNYREAEASYESRLLQYRTHSEQIEAMLEQGRAQLMVDVGRLKPELCYRIIPENETTGADPKAPIFHLLSSPFNVIPVGRLPLRTKANKKLFFFMLVTVNYSGTIRIKGSIFFA